MAGRPKAYDREKVLKRAMNLFWAKGFEGTHLQELVEETGLNRFSLYKEFYGKDGLFKEALTLYVTEAEANYKRILGKEPLGLANIIDYFDQITFPKDYSGCFMINTLTEKHIVSRHAFEVAKKAARKAKRLFRNNLEAAKQSGELAQDQDSKSLADFISALDQGMAIHGIIDSKKASRKRMTKLLENLLRSSCRLR